MASCDFRTSEASTKAYFRTNELVDKFLNIIDLPKFREEVTKWTDYASEKYNVKKGRLFFEEDGGKRAIPNTQAFNEIDKVKGVFFSRRTEVGKILNESTPSVSLSTSNAETFSQVKLSKADNKKLVDKMTSILNALEVTVGVATLPEDIAAQADILNRLILFSSDSLTDDNLTEETLHFVVELLEEKNPSLFNILMNEVWKYPVYTTVLNDYSSFPEYKKADGTRDIYKLKKEAVAQLLTEKLLGDTEINDKGFLAAVWQTISNYIKSFFKNVALTERDEFSKLADDILHTDFNNIGEINLSTGTFYSRKGTRVQRSLAKNRKLFGSKRDTAQDFSNASTEQVFNYITAEAAKISRVTEKELNPDTNEMEEVEYYVTETGKKQRITSILKESTKHLYANIDRSERAEALREAKMQKGTAIHKTIEDVYRRYIDSATGLRKTAPDPEPANYEVPKPIYLRLEASVYQRLESYPQGTRFMLETAVVDEISGLAGTVDFIAILPRPTDPTKFDKIDILDWKTTDISYVEHGIRKKRFDISPFNQGYWRNQLELYKTALFRYGIGDNFRQVRAIPILTETSVTKVDKTKPLTADNSIIEISSVKVGDVNTSNIPDDEFYSLPVPIYFESTEDKELDAVIEKLWGIYERIQKTRYSETEKFKKRLDLDKILASIRELQVKKKASRFTNLFHDSFRRYNLLAKEELTFLDTLAPNQKFLTEEQDGKVNLLLSELYDGIEFLTAFNDFPKVIRDLYPATGLTPSEKKVIDDVVKIGSNSAAIRKELENSAANIIDKLGRIYDIDQVSAKDVEKNWDLFKKFMSSILHREEKTIQLSARMINAMTYLGKQESRKYFNEKDGDFVKTHKAFVAWVNKNKTDIKSAYNLLFKKEVLSFTVGSVVYSKKDDKYFKDKAEIQFNEYFDTLKKNKKTLTNQKLGNAETLVPVIDSDFFDLLKIKQREFNEFYNSTLEKLADQNYKGKNRSILLRQAYQDEIMPFLQENFDLTLYDQDYKDAYEKYKLNLIGSVFDPDPIADALKKNRFLEEWEAAHNIYASPKALSTGNWLLRIKQSKWQSPEYSNLLKPENKALLDVYNLFVDINDRARKAGMLEDAFNARRFVPLVETDSFGRSFKLALQDLKESATPTNIGLSSLSLGAGILAGSTIGLGFGVGVGTAIAAKLLSSWTYSKFNDYFLPEKENSGYSDDIDPVTGAKKKQRKIAFKSVQDEDYLSNELFYNYALWADHIIKFEAISNYEDRLKMTQLVENLKTKAYGTDSAGAIGNKVTPGGLHDLARKATVRKGTNTFDNLDRIMDEYLYSNSLEYKPPYYKLANTLKDLTSSTFLGLKATSWVVNIIGASSAATLQKGKMFDNWDFEQAMARAFGLRNLATVGAGIVVGGAVGAVTGPLGGIAAAIATTSVVSKQLMKHTQPTDDERKIDYLTTLLGSRIASEYDRDGFKDFKDTWLSRVASGDFAYWGYRVGDHWLQDAIAIAILKNTTVISGKFVNIQEMVRKKYESERYQGTLPTEATFSDKLELSKKRREVERKIQKEIQELKSKDSIFHQMKEKGDMYDIGVDVTTEEGHAQLLSLANTIHSYSKSTIGNIDETDKSIAKMTWMMQFVTQFKNWIPRVYGARLSDLEWDYERNEITYGRYQAFGNAVKNSFGTVATEGLKNLLPLLAYVNPVAGIVGYGVSKATQNTVVYNVNIHEAARDQYQVKKVEWLSQGKDMTHFPTETQFIDIYTNGVRNTLHAIQQWSGVFFALALVASLRGDDDKAWYWRILARMMFGVNKELGGDKDPDQLLNLMGGSQNIIPVIGYLVEIKKFIEDFGGEMVGELQSKVGNVQKGKAKMKKAHPYHRGMNIIPVLREIHFWGLSGSKAYADFSEVPQPKAVK